MKKMEKGAGKSKHSHRAQGLQNRGIKAGNFVFALRVAPSRARLGSEVLWMVARECDTRTVVRCGCEGRGGGSACLGERLAFHAGLFSGARCWFLNPPLAL